MEWARYLLKVKFPHLSFCDWPSQFICIIKCQNSLPYKGWVMFYSMYRLSILLLVGRHLVTPTCWLLCPMVSIYTGIKQKGQFSESSKVTMEGLYNEGRVSIPQREEAPLSRQLTRRQVLLTHKYTCIKMSHWDGDVATRNGGRVMGQEWFTK